MPEVTIYLPEKKKKKEKPKDDLIIPGTPTIDDVLAVPAQLLVKFYDLGTYKGQDGNWYELPLLTNNEDYTLETRNVVIDRAAYERRQQTDQYRFYKNDYEFAVQDMIDEFGADNDNYLERKPLKPIITESGDTIPPNIQTRDEWYRWDGVGVDTPLLHLEVIKDLDSSDTREEGEMYRWTNQDVDPGGLENTYADEINENQKNQTRIYGSDEEYGYVINGIWIRKAHLRIQEIGSSSTCVHNTVSKYYGNDEFVDGVACMDTVEGIFWNGFNTWRDRVRQGPNGPLEQLYKITKEPYYSADAYEDPILRFSPAKQTRCEVYLMPRRWFYYAHFASNDVIEELKENLENDNYDLTWVSGLDPVTYSTTNWIFYDTIRDPITNYHNIFCIWDRPPHDYKLPRRQDIFGYYTFTARTGKPIYTSLMSVLFEDNQYEFEDETLVHWSSKYQVYDESMMDETVLDSYRWFDELIDNGLEYSLTEEEIGGESTTVVRVTSTEELEDTTVGYLHNYFSWEDKGFYWEEYRTLEGSLIGCREGVNSLYIYNFIGHAVANDTYEDIWVFDKYGMASYAVTTNYYGWVDYSNYELVSDDLAEALDVMVVYRALWPSPIWMQTDDEACVPMRVTNPWICQKVGRGVQWDGNLLLGDTTLYFIATWLTLNRYINQSYFETYHWVYTPPHGGLFNFGYDEDPPAIRAGLCKPDNNPQYIRYYSPTDSTQVTELMIEGTDRQLWEMPLILETERTCYNANGKYQEDECLEFDKFWDKIFNSDMVQQNLEEIDKGNYPADNVGYFTGVSLTKEHSLVAIIKVDSSVYYVWREIDEGKDYGRTLRDFQINGYSMLPSVEHEGMMQYSFPLYGCMDMWNPKTQIGNILSVPLKYEGEYDETDAGCYRITNSIVCNTIDWDENSHDEYNGFRWWTYDANGSQVEIYLPWTYGGEGGSNIDIENPTIDKEEVFELEQPVLLMTYRKRARFDTGYYASFFANGNCSNPSDNSYTAISAENRNRDRYEDETV